MIEECVNCGAKINWGPAFREKPRKCPFCKSSFDVANPTESFDLKGYFTKRGKKRLKNG